MILNRSNHLGDDLDERTQVLVHTEHLEQLGVPEDDVQTIQPATPCHGGRDGSEDESDQEQRAAKEVDYVPGVVEPHLHLLTHFHRFRGYDLPTHSAILLFQHWATFSQFFSFRKTVAPSFFKCF